MILLLFIVFREDSTTVMHKELQDIAEKFRFRFVFILTGGLSILIVLKSLVCL